MKKFFSLISLTCLVLLVHASSVLAASDAHHEGHGTHHPVNLTWPWINFAIYVVGLFIILRRPFGEMWSNRRRSLAELRERGALELRNAQGLLHDAEQKVANLETEAIQLERSLVSEGDKEGQQLVAEAKSRAERIAKQAEESISSEVRGAEITLRKELADKVLAQAADRLKRELNSDSDRSIREQVIGGVRGLVQ